ncbi:glutaredoxin family protein [Gracilibacillus marinus]|uniref:Glutaredoxin family protein n=1 Tax=Gracilibacillus marinus TaxID=630535 RepID=A0ABV8W0V4_9BACI
MYTTTMCSVCHMVREFLISMDIEFKEINVDIHPIELMKLIGKTKRFSVPQVNMYGEWIIGFNPVRMLEVMEVNRTEF